MNELIWVGNTLYPRWEVFMFIAICFGLVVAVIMGIVEAVTRLSCHLGRKATMQGERQMTRVTANVDFETVAEAIRFEDKFQKWMKTYPHFDVDTCIDKIKDDDDDREWSWDARLSQYVPIWRRRNDISDYPPTPPF